MKDTSILENSLRQGLVKVSFTKINGDRRDMTCTLRSDLIPDDLKPKTNRPTVENADGELEQATISVYDVDADGWRSFRKANIISYSTDI